MQTATDSIPYQSPRWISCAETAKLVRLHITNGYEEFGETIVYRMSRQPLLPVDTQVEPAFEPKTVEELEAITASLLGSAA